MKITTTDPFWRRLGLLHPVLAAWAAGAAALGLLVAGLTAAAQHEALVDALADGGSGTYTYSLTQHTLAMVVLGALSVAVATILVRTGSAVLAGAVLLATAFGPMTVVAAPVQAGLVSNQADTALWWHAVVGSVVAAVLAGWVAAVVHLLAGPHGPIRVPAEVVVMTAFASIGFVVCWNKSLEPLESVGLLPSAGWSVLAAGVAIAVARRGRLAAVSVLALASAAQLAMYAAYHRDGGWPGVAGWELNGMESPVVLSGAVAVMLVAAAPTGAGLGFLGRRLARHSRALPSTPVDVAAG